jgi:hypothetical protein
VDHIFQVHKHILSASVLECKTATESITTHSYPGIILSDAKYVSESDAPPVPSVCSTSASNISQYLCSYLSKT